MTEMQALPDDHPKLKKWNRYKRTQEFTNARRWALHEKHLDGSLWAVFNEGFESGIDIERQRTVERIEQLEAALRSARYLPIDRDTDTLEGYAGVIRTITAEALNIPQIVGDCAPSTEMVSGSDFIEMGYGDDD